MKELNARARKLLPWCFIIALIVLALAAPHYLPSQITNSSSVDFLIRKPEDSRHSSSEISLNEAALGFDNKIGFMVSALGPGPYGTGVFSIIDPLQFSIKAEEVLSDDSVIVAVKARRSLGSSVDLISYTDTMISGTRMDIPRKGEEAAGIPFRLLVLQPADSLIYSGDTTKVGDLSYLYLLKYSGLQVVPNKYTIVYSNLPLTYELLQGEPYDTLGPASRAVACAPMDGRFREITLHVDASTTSADTSVCFGLGYMTSTDGLTWTGPSSGAYQDSTYGVADTVRGIRDVPFFLRPTHTRARWIKFIAYWIDSGGQTIIKSVKATKR